MRIPRIYQDTFLSVGDTITLDAQATVHIARVLRLKPNDAVIVFNGRGGEFHGRILSQEKRSTVIVLETYDERSAESQISITLAQGVSRGERMDYTVQKAVELGVTQIIPLMTSRTSVNLDSERRQRRQEHWQTIVQSACEQCGRNTVPMVTEVQEFSTWLSHLNANQAESHNETKNMPVTKLVLYHKAEHSMASVVPESSDFLLLIGPEGGLNESEINAALQVGFIPVRLGPRVMRTETAAMVALTVLQSQWGDLRR